MARFSKLCDVIEDGRSFSKYLAQETFWYQYHGKPNPKRPRFFARSEAISNTVYNTLE